MQALYACAESEKANFQLALDRIENTFKPDLMAARSEDPHKLEGNRKLAKLIFEEHYAGQLLPADEEAPAEVKQAVQQAMDFYQTERLRDQKRFESLLISGTEKIFDQYLRIFLLVIELADYVQTEEANNQNRQLKQTPAAPKTLKLTNNRVVEAFRQHKGLQTEAIRRGLGWGNDRDFVKTLYREGLKPDPAYQAYQELKEATFSDDLTMVVHLLREIIFRHPEAWAWFEANDLYWSENRDVIKSMVNRTLRTVTEEDPLGLTLAVLSMDWEADREFFRNLYVVTLKNDADFEQMIARKAENWDVERVALTDKILLKMALSEMLHFPSIPVKVTINEYIEISKDYSTPKSKQFINGILDKLAADLTTQGLLKKSGRGLIDNK